MAPTTPPPCRHAHGGDPELTSLLQDQNLDLRVQAARVLGNISHFATKLFRG